jgi:hypothetical protein
MSDALDNSSGLFVVVVNAEHQQQPVTQRVQL